MAETTNDVEVDTAVRAVLTVLGSSRPPQLTVDYQGLAEPEALWDALIQLGWQVPSRPPPPATAIEWVTDGDGSQVHSLRPWRVDGLRVEGGSWRGEERDLVASHTLAILDHLGVDLVTDPPDLRYRLSDPVSSTPAPSQDPDPGSKQSPQAQASTTVDLPTVLALVQPPIPTELSSFDRFEAFGGPDASAQWMTTTLALESLSGEIRELLTAAREWAWTMDPPAVPLPLATAAGRTNLRVIVPDAYADNGLVVRLTRLMGDRIEAAVLRPFSDTSGRLGLLLAGDIEADRLDAIAQKLTEKYPGVICRGRPVAETGPQ